MQINNLNKTINLFITGSFLLFSFFMLDLYYETSYLKDLLGDLGGISTTFQVVIGIVFFPVLIFSGLIIESTTSLMRGGMRNLIERIPKIEELGLWFLYKQTDKKGYDFWREKFENATKTLVPDNLLDLNQIENKTTKFEHRYNDDIGRFNLASPILLNYAPAHYVDWVTRHHATYMLSTNLIVVLIINLILIFCLFGVKNIWLIYSLIWFVYLLYSIALDNLYYSYSLMYRFGFLKIKGKNIDEKISYKLI